MSKAEIEAELKRLLGIEKVIWFPGRRNVDITDVQIDAEARFVRPGVIAHSKPHAIAIDLWQELSAEICEILSRETDARVGACRSTLLRSRTHEAWFSLITMSCRRAM